MSWGTCQEGNPGILWQINNPEFNGQRFPLAGAVAGFRTQSDFHGFVGHSTPEFIRLWFGKQAAGCQLLSEFVKEA